MTSARYIAAQVRQRHPDFQWYSGSTYYSIQTLGETWGDSPGTYAEIRERNLPTRTRYGGFAVMGDSVTLSGGNILRVTSLERRKSKGGLAHDLLYQEVSAPSSLTSMSTLSLSSPTRVWTGIGLAGHTTPNVARLFYIRGSNNLMYYRDYTAGSGFGSTFQYTGSPTFNFDGASDCPDHTRRRLCHHLRSDFVQGDVAPFCGRRLDECGHADALFPASAQLSLV